MKLKDWRPIIRYAMIISINRGGGLQKKPLHDFSNYQIGKAKCQHPGLFLEHPFTNKENISSIP